MVAMEQVWGTPSQSGGGPRPLGLGRIITLVSRLDNSELRTKKRVFYGKL